MHGRQISLPGGSCADGTSLRGGRCLRRRTLVPLVGAAVLVLAPRRADAAVAPLGGGGVTLALAPIEVRGDWGGSLPGAALAVVSRARQACLSEVRLVSDQQPERIWVDDHSAEPPHIWLHGDGAPVAWIVVDIGPRDWSKLAYQFGHEFGHVLANSWGPEAKPANPCQWVEEALVEAFSIRGLGLLADSWEQEPPFPGDGGFGGSIRSYRDALLARYVALGHEHKADQGLAGWFRASRGDLESSGGVGGEARAAVPAVVAEMLAEPGGIEGLGALNRWVGRSGVPLDEYLRDWERSCGELRASPALPVWLRGALLG